MKIKIEFLCGVQLDYAVAKALNLKFETPVESKLQLVSKTDATYTGQFSPSKSWVNGGRLIERFGISIIKSDNAVDQWFATSNVKADTIKYETWVAPSSISNVFIHNDFLIKEENGYYGSTALIAAMRHLVFKLTGSDTVEFVASDFE